MSHAGTIVRVYTGKQQADANAAFARDAQQLAGNGYYPTTQSWAQGQWGCGAWLVALALCLLLVGLLVFVYMLIVKPTGTLTVTYEYRPPVQQPIPVAVVREGTEGPSLPCPRCAETIKVAARICRFCGLDLTVPQG